MENYSVPVNVRESDGSTASATSIPVEYGEHESLPMTSTQFLSCENLSVRVNSVNTRGISCPTPADQSNKDCQILAMHKVQIKGILKLS